LGSRSFLLEFGFRSFLLGFSALFFVWAVATGEIFFVELARFIFGFGFVGLAQFFV
jgi:hypothetical protein